MTGSHRYDDEIEENSTIEGSILTTQSYLNIYTVDRRVNLFMEVLPDGVSYVHRSINNTEVLVRR